MLKKWLEKKGNRVLIERNTELSHFISEQVEIIKGLEGLNLDKAKKLEQGFVYHLKVTSKQEASAILRAIEYLSTQMQWSIPKIMVTTSDLKKSKTRI